MKRRNFLSGLLAGPLALKGPSQIITVDLAAEKEKYIRLARAYIEEQIVKYGRIAPFFSPGQAQDSPKQLARGMGEEARLSPSSIVAVSR